MRDAVERDRRARFRCGEPAQGRKRAREVAFRRSPIAILPANWTGMVVAGQPHGCLRVFYANTPIAGLPLLPMLIGRPLGVMTSCSIGRPAA